ncbi:ABC transporter permease [Antribacter gilvus]|uniref:ABC transporter permease n=1 Tax=Antribacter gilvus TaxID=2304675 RepID=UPI000F76B5B9|nr:ABC transporter permease [Antribacter gilvus]
MTLRRRPGVEARADHAALAAFPLWAWLAFFVVVPLGLVAWYSLGQKPSLFSPVAVTTPSLDRYAEVLSPVFLTTFWATLRIGVTGTLLCLLVAVPFAYWLAVLVPARRRPLLLALVLVPFWTNFLVRTIGWQVILAKQGLLYEVLSFLHLMGPGDEVGILYTRAAVQLGVVYNYLPLMILPLYVAFERTDPRLREAGRDLGAGRLRTFLTVTLPQAAPGVAAGCLLVFVPLMGDYLTASVLGGADGIMAGQLVAQQFGAANDWALGSAMAFTLMGLVLATVLVVGALGLVGRGMVRRVRRVEPAPRGGAG